MLESFRDSHGIERLMDYIFYQVAAINGYDAVGHYLRAELIVNQCATYAVLPVAGCSANFPNSASASNALASAASATASDDPLLQRTARALARALGMQVPEDTKQPKAKHKTKKGKPGEKAKRKHKTAKPAPDKAAPTSPAATPTPGTVPAVPAAPAVPVPAPRRGAERHRRADRDAHGHADGRPGGRAARLPLRPRRRGRMRGRGGNIAGNPVLIGAATILVIIVAVFLSYNANTGLPFVPSYQVNAEVPNAAQLVVGNDVKIGGSRVGAVSAITPKTLNDGRTIAVLGLKLDKDAGPLPQDTTLIVRPRNALGLKYVELSPGRSSHTYEDGDTIPLARAKTPVELDEFLNMFDDKTRARRPGRPERLRHRVRRPRRVDQHGDRRVPAAAARRRAGDAEPVLAGDEPAPLHPRIG